MNVVLTASAEADLESLGDWIAQSNPARALTFVRDIRERCDGLVDIPYAYPLIPRYEHGGIRRRLHVSYLIFYRIAGETIVVLRVLHGARHYEAILFPQD
jgi:plasmid stabilization system protein ParE